LRRKKPQKSLVSGNLCRLLGNRGEEGKSCGGYWYRPIGLSGNAYRWVDESGPLFYRWQTGFEFHWENPLGNKRVLLGNAGEHGGGDPLSYFKYIFSGLEGAQIIQSGPQKKGVLLRDKSRGEREVFFSGRKAFWGLLP